MKYDIEICWYIAHKSICDLAEGMGRCWSKSICLWKFTLIDSGTAMYRSKWYNHITFTNYCNLSLLEISHVYVYLYIYIYTFISPRDGCHNGVGIGKISIDIMDLIELHNMCNNFSCHCCAVWFLLNIILTQIYVHDPVDIPQMKELGKSVLPGVHTLGSLSYSQVIHIISYKYITVHMIPASKYS